MERRHSVATDIRRFDGSIRLPLAVAAVIAVGMTVISWIVFRLVPGYGGLLGLFVVGPILLGVAHARWGIVGGVLVAGAVAGNWPGAVGLAIAAFVAGSVCAQLGPIHAERPSRWLAANGGVAVVAILALGATAGFLAELRRTQAFAIQFHEMIRHTLPVTLAGLPIVWVLYERFERTPGSIRPQDRLLTVGIVLVWAFGSFTTSVILQLFDNDPAIFIGRRFGPLARNAIEFVGGGRGVMLLFGAAALMSLLYVGRST